MHRGERVGSIGRFKGNHLGSIEILGCLLVSHPNSVDVSLQHSITELGKPFTNDISEVVLRQAYDGTQSSCSNGVSIERRAELLFGKCLEGKCNPFTTRRQFAQHQAVRTRRVFIVCHSY